MSSPPDCGFRVSDLVPLSSHLLLGNNHHRGCGDCFFVLLCLLFVHLFISLKAGLNMRQLATYVHDNYVIQVLIHGWIPSDGFTMRLHTYTHTHSFVYIYAATGNRILYFRVTFFVYCVPHFPTCHALFFVTHFTLMPCTFFF